MRRSADRSLFVPRCAGRTLRLLAFFLSRLFLFPFFFRTVEPEHPVFKTFGLFCCLLATNGNAFRCHLEKNPNRVFCSGFTQRGDPVALSWEPLSRLIAVPIAHWGSRA